MKPKFSNFIVSKSNEFAYLCAKRFAENIVSDIENEELSVLCISGKSGVGKTHLILSIQDELMEREVPPNVLCIEISQFIDMYVNAIKQGKIVEFEKDFNNYDALLVENTHELWGKEASSEEFYRLLKNALALKKKVAITFNLEMLDDIKSSIYNKYLMCIIDSSLKATIEQPDSELLFRYFCAKTADMDIEITRTMKQHIYECESINGLIGYIKRLKMDAVLSEESSDLPRTR